MSPFEVLLFAAGGFVASAIVGGVASGLVGLFRPFAYVVLPATGVALSFWVARQHRDPAALMRAALVGGVALLGISAYAGTYAHSTWDAGRDDGVYATAAARLATEGGFATADPLTATFPGYHESSPSRFSPQFLPGYIAIAGVAAAWGGAGAIPLANAALLSIGLGSIAVVAHRTSSSTGAWVATLLVATHYTTWWFSRKVYAENALLALFWLAAAALLSRPCRASLTTAAIAVVALIVTRPEAPLLMVALAAGAVVLEWRRIRPRLAAVPRTVAWAVVIGIAGAATVVVAVASLVATPTYLEGVLSVPRLLWIRLQLLVSPLPANDAMTYARYLPQFVWKMLMAYGLVPLMVAALAAAVLKPTRPLLAVIIFAAPSLLYLADPVITPDQPFFMRRYWPLFLPLLAIMTAALATHAMDRVRAPYSTAARARPVVVAVALLATLQAAWAAPVALAIDGDGLDQSAARLAATARAAGADLVLFHAGPYGALAGSLAAFERLPVAYLPTADIEGPKYPPESPLDITNAHVYLGLGHKSAVLVSHVAPESGNPISSYFPNDDLRFIASTNVTYSHLQPTCDIITHITTLPTREAINTSFIEEQCSGTPPRTIHYRSTPLHLYAVTSSAFLVFRGENPDVILHSSEWAVDAAGASCARGRASCGIHFAAAAAEPRVVLMTYLTPDGQPAAVRGLTREGGALWNATLPPGSEWSTARLDLPAGVSWLAMPQGVVLASVALDES